MKSNLCSVIAKKPNYDYVAYDFAATTKKSASEFEINKLLIEAMNKNQSQTKSKDDLDTILSPRVKSQSRSRLPIYYQPDNNESDLKEIGEETIYDLPWHSTKIDFAHMHATGCETILTNKITDESTIQNRPQPNNSYSSSANTSQNSSMESNNEQPSDVYACCLNYDAKHDGDLTVRFADRISVVYDSGEEFILVKLLRTHKVGYVPRICILNVNKFLAQLS